MTQPCPIPVRDQVATRSTSQQQRLLPRLLRTTEAARYLGMGGKAIRHLIVSGQLPYVQMKPGNSPFLLDRRDLDKFIEMHKIGGPREL